MESNLRENISVTPDNTPSSILFHQAYHDTPHALIGGALRSGGYRPRRFRMRGGLTTGGMHKHRRYKRKRAVGRGGKLRVKAYWRRGTWVRSHARRRR